MGRIKKSTAYRHFKGGEYFVLDFATHTETGEKYVVYAEIGLESFGRTWVRPYEMFASEVDHEKYPDATQKYRFEEVER